jgi:hypothetical protein
MFSELDTKKDELLNQRADLIKARNKASFEQNFTMRDSYEKQIEFVEKQIKEI